MYTFLPSTSGHLGTVATQSWVVRGIPPVSATCKTRDADGGLGKASRVFSERESAGQAAYKMATESTEMCLALSGCHRNVFCGFSSV